MPRRTKIVATLGPATDTGGDGRHARRRRRRGPAQPLPRHPRAPPRPRRAPCATAPGRRATTARWGAVDLQGPRSASGASPTAHRPRRGPFTLDAACPLDAATGPRSAPPIPSWQGRESRRYPAAGRRGHRALGGGRWHPHRLPRGHGWQALQQQGHQQEGRRPLGPGPHREGQGGHPLRRRDRADYLAVSFVRNGRRRAARPGAVPGGRRQGRHRRQDRAGRGPDAIDDIIDAADVIMVARGDLGVEIGDAELPAVQKR
jgi:pyruvate kinase